MSVLLLKKKIVHYEVLGRGRPVIFLHSWVGSWRYWIPMMQTASTKYRAYALDLWGFGDTAKVESEYAISGQTDLLKGFLEEMGMGKVALVGHGLGAIVALSFASQNPGLVSRVMAVSHPINTAMINKRLISESPVSIADWLANGMPSLDTVRSDARKIDPNAITTFLNGLGDDKLHALCDQPKLMCLLLNGLNDPVIMTPVEDMSKLLPYKTHMMIFEESGHFPMLEKPNKFNRLLVEFLTMDSGDSLRNLALKDEWKRRVR